MRTISLITFLFLLSCQKEIKTTDYNVLVLFTDDQRWNTIRAWGNEEIHTPNLDRLSKIGVNFTNAHVMGSHHGAVCAPSRAMLLSGMSYLAIPKKYINLGASPSLEFPFMTFPEYFRNRGYQTFFTGKWHNHTSKLRQGFEGGKNIFIGGMHWPREGGHEQPWLWDFDSSGVYSKNQKWQGKEFSSKMYSDAAIDFLNQRDASKPFCMYVAYTSPHDPRTAPQEYLAMYDTAQISIPPNYLPEHPFDNGQLRIRDENLAPFPRTKAIVKQEIKGYYAMISEVDAQIGRILNELEAKNMMDNTIIVFAGDNGLAVGQHGLLGKQSLYEHSVRVPLIIAAPKLEGNREARTLCYLYDVFPTLCDLTGGELPKDLKYDPDKNIYIGKSLMPVLKDEEHITRNDLYLAYGKWQRSLKTSDGWKLIQYFVKGEEHFQFYNLNEDPWEMHNLAEDEANKEQFDNLSRRLTQYSIDNYDGFFNPVIQTNNTELGEPVEVTILAPKGSGVEIRYTLDGGNPDTSGLRYTTPFLVTNKAEIAVQAFYNQNPISNVKQETIVVVQTIKNLEITKPDLQYPGNGSFTLVDGLYASQDFKSRRWLGYQGIDFEGLIDFGEQRTVSKVGLSYLSTPGAWIFPPEKIEIAVSQNGKDFQSVASTTNEITSTTKDGLFRFDKPLSSRQIRFVKFNVKNIGECPEWHEGTGGKSWIFIDELIVE